MKKNLYSPADEQASLLKVTLYPEYGKMCISCSDNHINVYFAKPCPPGTRPVVFDVTADPEAFFSSPGILIRNAARHNHIVAAYHPDDGCVVVKHRKHIYSIVLPGEVAVIYCGGNVLYFS